MSYFSSFSLSAITISNIDFPASFSLLRSQDHRGMRWSDLVSNDELWPTKYIPRIVAQRWPMARLRTATTLMTTHLPDSSTSSTRHLQTGKLEKISSLKDCKWRCSSYLPIKTKEYSAMTELWSCLQDETVEVVVAFAFNYFNTKRVGLVNNLMGGSWSLVSILP